MSTNIAKIRHFSHKYFLRPHSLKNSASTWESGELFLVNPANILLNAAVKGFMFVFRQIVARNYLIYCTCDAKSHPGSGITTKSSL